MAWIESHQELKDHPKTRKLAALLGIPRMQAVGHLHALWWWALDYAENGDLSRFDAEDIALGAEWDVRGTSDGRDADAFVSALKQCGPGGHSGFLDDDDWLHDWDVYAGKLVDRRRADRERKRTSRATTKDVPRTSAGRDADVHAAAYVPNPTQPNLSSADKPTRKKRGTHIPDDFVVTEAMEAWAREHLPGFDWHRETENFIDWWKGSGGIKADWPATWRGWMRRNYAGATATAKVVER